MSAAEIALIVLAVVALVGTALWSVAQRLDRLHRREFQTRATLEAQLTRRANAAADLAASGVLDPASAMLVADAATTSLGAARLIGDDDPDAATDRSLVESDLTSALRAVLRGSESEPDAGDSEPLQRLRHAHYRVGLARRFHNDAVVAIQQIRRLWLVRTFRLAGHAALPSTFEMDDATL